MEGEPKIPNAYEQLRATLKAMQEKELEKGDGAYPDIVGIPVDQLTEKELELFGKLKDQTLTLEELEEARQSFNPIFKYFYTFLANELQKMMYRMGKYK